MTPGWGGYTMYRSLYLWSHLDGEWYSTMNAVTVNWDYILFTVNSGWENPNVPNHCWVFNTGVYAPAERSWQRKTCPAWLRWQWTTGTKPRWGLRVRTTGAKGLFDYLNRGDGVQIQFDPGLGVGCWTYDNYGQWASRIVFQCVVWEP